jgi:hypothetical protein
MFHVKHWAQPQTPVPAGGEGGEHAGGRGGAQGLAGGLPSLPVSAWPGGKGSSRLMVDMCSCLCYNVGAQAGLAGSALRRR